MKKYYLIATCLFAVLTGVYFTSCDKDDDDNNALVGTWLEGSSGNDMYYVSFFSDGTGYAYEVYTGSGQSYLDDVDSFTYNYDEKNNILNAYYNDGSGSSVRLFEIVSITNDVLIFKRQGYSYTYTYTKVKAPVTKQELAQYLNRYSSSYYY